MKKLFLFLFCFGGVNAQSNDDGRTINIPVIFHVIYSDRQHDGAGGANTSENVPTALLIAELNSLNLDFLKLNTDINQVAPQFQGITGNPNINFFLADTILQPGGEKGIKRVKDSRNKSRLYNRSDIIDHERYLNVYIGNIPGSFSPSQTPWLIPDKDAVFLEFSWIGQGYRLLTHEVAHWMGLLHLWGTGTAFGDAQSCTVGDGISDTPPQKEATQTNADCDDCPPPYGKAAVQKKCPGGQETNFNNFMDYSGCRKMFTIEQAKAMRMNAMLHRQKLWAKSMPLKK